MRLTVFVEPQLGASYTDVLRVARRAEDCGYDAFFRSDHYLGMPPGDGLPGPTDAWTTLAGLARETATIRIGTLVSSATFRLPGPLAIAVAQVDQMSGGRVEFGMGAGWFSPEHTAYGIPFPPLGERFDRLAEQLEVITGLWWTPAGERFSFTGRWYEVVDSPALPKPVQRPGPTVIIGGWGTRRTPALAARFADEFNVPFRSLPDTVELFACARQAGQGRVAAGRAPLVFSVAQTVCCGRDDAQVRQRAEATGMALERLRSQGVVGTPDEVVAQIGAYAQAGATRIHLQFLDLHDLDHVELVASAVACQLR